MKRRFATRYYSDNSNRSAMAAHGAAATIKGAVRATIVRVFMREYGDSCFAVIYDRELEVDLARVTLGSTGLRVNLTDTARGLAGIDD